MRLCPCLLTGCAKLRFVLPICETHFLSTRWYEVHGKGWKAPEYFFRHFRWRATWGQEANVGTRNLREDDSCTSAGLGGMFSPSSGLTPLVSTGKKHTAGGGLRLWEGGCGCGKRAVAATSGSKVSHSWSALGIGRTEFSFELDITIFLPLLCSIYGSHY